MALAPKLEFRQSQQLVMTPQLQQAIKLLQLSNLELAEFVEEQLEENPFLERSEATDDTRPSNAAKRKQPPNPQMASARKSISAIQTAHRTRANPSMLIMRM